MLVLDDEVGYEEYLEDSDTAAGIRNDGEYSDCMHRRDVRRRI